MIYSREEKKEVYVKDGYDMEGNNLFLDPRLQDKEGFITAEEGLRTGLRTGPGC